MQLFENHILSPPSELQALTELAPADTHPTARLLATANAASGISFGDKASTTVLLNESGVPTPQNRIIPDPALSPESNPAIGFACIHMQHWLSQNGAFYNKPGVRPTDASSPEQAAGIAIYERHGDELLIRAHDPRVIKTHADSFTRNGVTFEFNKDQLIVDPERHELGEVLFAAITAESGVRVLEQRVDVAPMTNDFGDHTWVLRKLLADQGDGLSPACQYVQQGDTMDFAGVARLGDGRNHQSFLYQLHTQKFPGIRVTDTQEHIARFLSEAESLSMKVAHTIENQFAEHIRQHAPELSQGKPCVRDIAVDVTGTWKDDTLRPVVMNARFPVDDFDGLKDVGDRVDYRKFQAIRAQILAENVREAEQPAL